MWTSPNMAVIRVVVWTSFRSSGAGGLVRYIKSKGRVFSRDGRELSDLQREEFIDKSEELNFERLLVFSPPRGEEMSDRDMSLYVREQMDLAFSNSPTCDYVYAIHRDTDHPHVMVAATGEKRDLRLHQKDLAKLRSNECDVLRELGCELSPSFERYFKQEQELEFGRGLWNE